MSAYRPSKNFPLRWNNLGLFVNVFTAFVMRVSISHWTLKVLWHNVPKKCCWLIWRPYVKTCPQFSSDKLPDAVLLKSLAVLCPPLPYIWYNIAQKLLTLYHWHLKSRSKRSGKRSGVLVVGAGEVKLLEMEDDSLAVIAGNLWLFSRSSSKPSMAKPLQPVQTVLMRNKSSTNKRLLSWCSRCVMTFILACPQRGTCSLQWQLERAEN